MNAKKQKSFKAIIQKESSFIFVEIPFSLREAWETKPPYRVTGVINGISVRGTLGAQGQNYFLRLSAVWMRESGIELGARVTVQLNLEDAGDKD